MQTHTQCMASGRWNPQRLFRKFCLVNGLLLLLLQTSCVGPHGPPPDGEPPFSVQPTFPEWLTGDLASLFAGVNDFTAKLEVRAGDTSPANLLQPGCGDLSGRDGSLLFIPEMKRQRHGPPGSAPGGMSFLRNSRSNAAFVLNEPMQAYAPANASPASATREVVALGKEAVDGRQCQKWQVACAAGNGTTNVITVWRAGELNDVPVKIQAGNSSSTVTLVLSRISFKALSSEVSSVPDGFTRYASMEAMMTEFMARQRPMMPGRMGGMPPGGPGGRPPPGGGPP